MKDELANKKTLLMYGVMSDKRFRLRLLKVRLFVLLRIRIQLLLKTSGSTFLFCRPTYFLLTHSVKTLFHVGR